MEKKHNIGKEKRNTKFEIRNTKKEKKDTEKNDEQEAEEYLEGWRRCQAEFENYKKSKMNLEKDMAGRAVEDFAYKLLPVIDNFHASTDHIPEDQLGGAWVQGILYIQKQLEQVLAEMNVIEIEAREGDKFDPNFHEAVEETKVESRRSKVEGQNLEVEEEEGTGGVEVHPVKSAEDGGAEQFNRVKKVLVRGYKRGERVIRPVRVVVS